MDKEINQQSITNKFGKRARRNFEADFYRVFDQLNPFLRISIEKNLRAI